MSMTTEDVRIIYVPDAKNGQILLDKVLLSEKQMHIYKQSEQLLLTKLEETIKMQDDYMQDVGRWVSKVNTNLDGVNKTLADNAVETKQTNERIVENLEAIQKEIIVIQKELTDHMDWHKENGSLWMKIFRK